MGKYIEVTLRRKRLRCNVEIQKESLFSTLKTLMTLGMSKIKKEGITCCTINSGMDDFVAKPYI